MEIEETLKYMLSFFQGTDKRQSALNQDLSVLDTKQDEILHYIEIHNLNASQCCKIIKQLKSIRDERRLVKNELTIVSSLKDTFVDKYKNKFIENDIIQALKKIRSLKEKQNNPKYTYKYLTEDWEVRDTNE